MSRRSEGRAGTAIKSLAGKAYVPVDKIKLRQEERKAKNRYQAIKQQEEKQKRKKTTHTDDDSQVSETLVPLIPRQTLLVLLR